MARFRKLPVTVEAVRYTGDNTAEIAAFAGEAAILDAGGLKIRTLEGDMDAPAGWWIIRGVAGEFYPCDPDVFAATYEEVHDAPPPSMRATPRPPVTAARGHGPDGTVPRGQGQDRGQGQQGPPPVPPGHASAISQDPTRNEKTTPAAANTPEPDPGSGSGMSTLRVKVSVDPDALRAWAERHADRGDAGVAHVLYRTLELIEAGQVDWLNSGGATPEGRP